MNGFRFFAWFTAILLLLTTGRGLLQAQCPPPAGVYTLTAVPASGTACPGTTICLDIIGDTGGAALIEAFGFNLSIAGGPIVSTSVTPGFGAPPGTFLSEVSTAFDQVAAAGIGDIQDPLFSGLSVLANVCIQLDPTFVGPLVITFGGNLALPNGQVIIDHLVVAGCDVWSGSTPALTATGASFPCPKFIRGDCNNNGLVAGFMGDIVFIFEFLFIGGATPDCMSACDVDDSDVVNITDALVLIDWQFSTGSVPPPPSPTYTVGGAVAFLSDCGLDPNLGTLTCGSNICPP